MRTCRPKPGSWPTPTRTARLPPSPGAPGSSTGVPSTSRTWRSSGSPRTSSWARAGSSSIPMARARDGTWLARASPTCSSPATGRPGRISAGTCPFVTDIAALDRSAGYTLVRSFDGGRLLLYAVAEPADHGRVTGPMFADISLLRIVGPARRRRPGGRRCAPAAAVGQRKPCPGARPPRGRGRPGRRRDLPGPRPTVAGHPRPRGRAARAPDHGPHRRRRALLPADPLRPRSRRARVAAGRTPGAGARRGPDRGPGRRALGRGPGLHPGVQRGGEPGGRARRGAGRGGRRARPRAGHRRRLHETGLRTSRGRPASTSSASR